MTYREKLEDQIKRLTERLEQLKSEFNQVKGGLEATKGLLNEYIKTMTAEQEILAYCEQQGIRLTESELAEAVDLVENQGYTVEDAVLEADEDDEQNPTSPDPDKP
jgi:hypothetical protein